MTEDRYGTRKPSALQILCWRGNQRVTCIRRHRLQESFCLRRELLYNNLIELMFILYMPFRMLVHADHVAPSNLQKLALTSLTSDGRLVGIVRSRTKATKFSFISSVVGSDTILQAESRGFNSL
jgi:hypothetical protein